MAVITKIEPQKKKERVNIFVDESFFCGLERETAIKFGLKVGKIIDSETLSLAIEQSEQKRAFEKALSLISIRLHTSKEIFDKLSKKGFNESAISFAIKKLEEYHYIDDENFVKEYINQNQKYSKLMLKNKLIQKGIDKNIIEDTFNELSSNDDEINLCKRYIEKYIRSKSSLKQLEKKKLIASLARRGFSFDTISISLKDYDLNYDDD